LDAPTTTTATATVPPKKNKSGGTNKTSSLLGNPGGGLMALPDGVHHEFDIDGSGHETLFDGPDSKFLFDALHHHTNDGSTTQLGLNRDSNLAVSTYSHSQSNSNSHSRMNSNSSGLGVQNRRLGNSLDPATMLEELVQQQAMQDSFEHRLRELEHQSARVTGENALLKRVVTEIGGRQAETQQRVDGLLKFIYSVFITNADSLPTSIAQSAVCMFMLFNNNSNDNHNHTSIIYCPSLIFIYVSFISTFCFK